MKANLSLACSNLSLTLRIENALVSYIRYLGKAFWPVDLGVFYPHPERGLLVELTGAGALLAGLSIVALWLRRRFLFVVTGWLWFLGTLVPVIGLVQVGDQSMADRYTYVPLIGVFIVLVWGGNEIMEHWRAQRAVAWSVTLLVLSACAVRTRGQLSYWQNTETLFRHTLEVTENNYVASYALGIYLAGKGELEQATHFFRQAVRINPRYSGYYNILGKVLVRQGRLAEAIDNFRKALELDPNNAEAHKNLAQALAGQGKFAEAVGHYEAALRWRPDQADVHYGLGDALTEIGKPDDAIEHYRQALRYRPDYVDAPQQSGCPARHEGQSERSHPRIHGSLALCPQPRLGSQQLGGCPAGSRTKGRSEKSLPGERSRLNPEARKSVTNSGCFLRPKAPRPRRFSTCVKPSG